MFTRIMAIVVAVILLVTMSLASLGGVMLQGQKVNGSLEALTKEAREIAYLAAQNNSGSGFGFFFGTGSDMSEYISWKAEQVYQEYGAYILVVDRRGRIMDNMNLTYADNPDFAASLSSREITQAMAKILGGEEISLRIMIGDMATFTVGVPFVQDERVLGAVLIQTPVQKIEAQANGVVFPIMIVSVMATMIAGMGIFLCVWRMMRPLNALTRASRSMAGGEFNVRVHPDKATPEIAELSESFNTMAEKLSEVEQNRREFVANVSHELRSPITSIRGFVEGMEDGTIPQEEHPKYLALVGDETRRLSKLIGDLLALSRLEREDVSLEYTDFDMNEMLRRAIIRRVNDLEAKQMEIECRFVEGSCMVHADSDRIEQVVVNLLDNAIKFTPSGGQITLTTEVDRDVATVTIQDNGTGILPEDRPKVFERFFTADRAHTAGKGTGLGLSICQRILEMHGQRIWLKDTQAGAAFAFTLERAGH